MRYCIVLLFFVVCTAFVMADARRHRRDRDREDREDRYEDDDRRSHRYEDEEKYRPRFRSFRPIIEDEQQQEDAVPTPPPQLESPVAEPANPHLAHVTTRSSEPPRSFSPRFVQTFAPADDAKAKESATSSGNAKLDAAADAALDSKRAKLQADISQQEQALAQAEADADIARTKAAANAKAAQDEVAQPFEKDPGNLGLTFPKAVQESPVVVLPKEPAPPAKDAKKLREATAATLEAAASAMQPKIGGVSVRPIVVIDPNAPVMNIQKAADGSIEASPTKAEDYGTPVDGPGSKGKGVTPIPKDPNAPATEEGANPEDNPNILWTPPRKPSHYVEAEALLNDEMAINVQQLNKEAEWVKNVQQIFIDYAKKIRKVRAHMTKLKQHIIQLDVKRRQVANIRLQQTLQTKLSEAEGDLGILKKELRSVHSRVREFKESKQQVSSTIAEIRNELARLRGPRKPVPVRK